MTEYTRSSGFGQFVLIIILLLILGVAGVWYYNRTHVVTAGDKVGKAVDALPAVVSKAADEATDKATLVKVDNAIKETGHVAASAMSKTGEAASSVASKTSATVKKEKEEARQ